MQTTVWNRTGALFPIFSCQGQEACGPECNNGCSPFVELYFMLVGKLAESSLQFSVLIFFFFFLQHEAAQILYGGYAPVPCKTDDAVALYCSPPSPPAWRAVLQWNSKVFCLEDGDSGSGWYTLKRKMSPLHKGHIKGEEFYFFFFFNKEENQVIIG